MSNHPILRPHEQWSHFRFSVVGPLLISPLERGALQAELSHLAGRTWRHPISGQPCRFGVSTIERWYYLARREKRDPVAVLRRRIRSDHGTYRGLSAALAAALHAQYREHPSWSYQLHADNLVARAEKKTELGRCPSYACVARYMKSHGLFKRPRRGPVHSPGARVAEARFEAREVRSFECEYVNGLWHLDFHHGSRRVLLADGAWAYPILLAILDDRSRLCCHAQWYLSEGAEELCHGLSQALQKRVLPRALLHDNGSAMLAAETVQGLKRLGILQETTLPFSPYQNGKQEVYWTQIEGRLLPMLEAVADLSLKGLNDATQAWVELEYHKQPHSEIKTSPLECYVSCQDVGRPCPSAEALRLAFTGELARMQRRSDGTISLSGVRYEVPARFGHFREVTVRVASWDLSQVHLSDAKTGAILCRLYPMDKHRNAEGRRASRPGTPPAPPPAASSGAMAPLLQKLVAQYAATGLPPAYLPKDELLSPSPAPPAPKP
jgi:transposase InsO family protein